MHTLTQQPAACLRPLRYLFILFFSVIAGNATATGVELLVIEQDDCPYCERFNRDIAPAYPKTSEGRQAPLRQLDLHRPWPTEYANVTPANFTPTFILIRDGTEVDRLTGYPGDNYFWFLLREMLEKLQESTPE
ncbi:MAG: thioredoxin fold domain-containing protein [Granulosicoccus sp.]